MKRRIVVSFTAGLLAASGCGNKDGAVTSNPPEIMGETTEGGAPSEGGDPAQAGGEATDGASTDPTDETTTDGTEATPGAAPPPRTSNPPPPHLGTGPDGRELIPVPPPDIMPSKPKPLPTWDEAASRHPEGATNPPSPVLIVGEDGACFKRWVSPFTRSRESMTPHVETCTDSADTPDGNTCGTPIQCPPEAADVLAAHKANKGAP